MSKELQRAVQSTTLESEELYVVFLIREHRGQKITEFFLDSHLPVARKKSFRGNMVLYRKVQQSNANRDLSKLGTEVL